MNKSYRQTRVYSFDPGQRGMISGKLYEADAEGLVRRVYPPDSMESYHRALRGELKRLRCPAAKFKIKAPTVDGTGPTVSYGKVLDCVDYVKFAMMLTKLPSNCDLAVVLREGAKI